MPPNTPLAAGPATDDRTRFVLVQTSHAGNVGAAARAMKVMGFTDLVLVAPRREGLLSHPDAVAMASGAADILVRARVVDTLDAALDGIGLACATAMTPRDFGPPTAAPREALPALAAQVQAQGLRVAFVFGSERVGLANADVWRCHLALSIPTAPEYGSLNLAQALQCIAYDWRCALGAAPVLPRTRMVPLADGPALAGLLAHWQQVLLAIGFLDPASPKRLLPRLRQLLLRARPTAEEVHILRGIARAVQGQAVQRQAVQGPAVQGQAEPGPAAQGQTPPPG